LTSLKRTPPTPSSKKSLLHTPCYPIRKEERADDDGGEFNWNDFYRSQFSGAITKETLEADKLRYQGSDEEKLAIIEAYLLHEGDLNGIFEEVMHSDILEDEERFKEIIDQEIAAKRVESYPRYAAEQKATNKKKRQAGAQKERAEAEKMAKEQNLLGDLSVMIQKRQQARESGHASLLDRLEAKYGPKKKNSRNKRPTDEPPEEAFHRTGQKSKKRRAADEPPEEAFQRTADRAKTLKRPKASKRSKVIVEEEDEENQVQVAVEDGQRRSGTSRA
jgi:DnaJ homolog subfamily C member 9